MAVPEKSYGDDMAVIGDLTEDSLPHELKRRYERNTIYVRYPLITRCILSKCYKL